MNILVFTSNIGAYLQILPLLKKYQSRFNRITFLLSGNCFNLKPDFKNSKLINKKIFSKKDLELHLEENKYICAFVGMTALKNTKENYLCFLCNKLFIKTWTIQDYPQYYGTFSKKYHPNNILVLDSQSYLDCKINFPSANTFQILSPKHLFYEINSDTLSIINKKRNSNKSKSLTIAFQPFLPGVKQNLYRFIEKIEREKIYFDVCLHPDQFNETNLIKELEAFKYLNQINKTINDNIISFFSSSHLITCFSTVAIDIDHGLGNLKSCCNKVHYLFEGEMIKKTFRSSSSNLKEPYITNNIPCEIYNDVNECYKNIVSDLKLKDKKIKINKLIKNDLEMQNKIDYQINQLFKVIG